MAMTNEELVKRLREHGEFLIVSDRMKAPPNVNVRNVFSEDYYQAADAIENVSKAYWMMTEAYESEVTKSRWIPVTERLPEKYHQVLVYGLNGMQIDYYAGEKSIGGRPLFMISEAKVTHWMPLPEPPTEENENDKSDMR